MTEHVQKLTLSSSALVSKILPHLKALVLKGCLPAVITCGKIHCLMAAVSFVKSSSLPRDSQATIYVRRGRGIKEIERVERRQRPAREAGLG